MLSKIRGCLHTLLLSGTSLVAGAGRVPEVIESSLGDQLEISASPNERARPQTIEACLMDATNGEAKGFDIRHDHAPRYVTRDHLPVCAELFAGPHRLVLWRSSLGHFQPVVSLPIDLSGRSGERLSIIWRVDGAISGPRAPKPQD